MSPTSFALRLPALRASLLTMMFGLSWACCTPAQAQPDDAHNEQQALAFIDRQIDIVEAVRQHCGQALPAHKFKIDLMALKWRLDNMEFIKAVQSFKETDPAYAQIEQTNAATVVRTLDTFKRKVATLSADGVCGGIFQQITSGKHDVATATPYTATLLRGYVSRHPLAKSSAARLDFLLGCQVSAVKHNKDHDAARAGCQCIHEVQARNVTPAQRAELDERLTQGGDIATLPFLQQIRPQLQACAQSAPP